MNAWLARQVVTLVLMQLAEQWHIPLLKKLDIAVQVEETDTASANQGQGGQAVITLPYRFQAVEVERDNDLYLGLVSHEIGHLPGLKPTLELMERAAGEGGAALQGLFNLVEDMRIEMTMLDDPANRWLTRPRALCCPEGPPEDFWGLLRWIRFGYPPEPYTCSQPRALYEAYEGLGSWQARKNALYNLIQLHPAVCTVLNTSLPGGTPWSAYKAAREILALAEQFDVAVPQPPPPTQSVGGGPGIRVNEPDGQGAGGPQPGGGSGGGAGEPLPALPVPAPRSFGTGEGIAWDAPNPQIVAAGQRLSRRMARWWTRAPTRPVAGGVGRYNPRLEPRGIAPFQMAVARQEAPPPRLALFLDVSDSMYYDCPALDIARQATVAVVSAVKEAGGQVAVWAFHGEDHALPLGDDLQYITTVKGNGTELKFLGDAVRKFRVGDGWQYLFITDANIGQVPACWDARQRANSTVVFIRDPGARQAYPERLGERVIAIQRLDELPDAINLAARRFFRAAGRA